MASAIIHMAVAKRVCDELGINFSREIQLGSIAPDCAKLIGISRDITHFAKNPNDDPPCIEIFLSKYKDTLKNDFELGYYCHLLTDVLWFNEFCKNIVDDDLVVTTVNGDKMSVSPEEYSKLIYNDYTNLNTSVIDYYGLDLSLFYENFKYPISHIEELKVEYFPKLIERMSLIMQGKSYHHYLLDIKNITHFIEFAAIYCLDEIKKLDI